jgi:hypothetical protein
MPWTFKFVNAVFNFIILAPFLSITHTSKIMTVMNMYKWQLTSDSRVFWSERTPHKDKTVVVQNKIKFWSWAPDGRGSTARQTDWLNVSNKVTDFDLILTEDEPFTAFVKGVYGLVIRRYEYWPASIVRSVQLHLFPSLVPPSSSKRR